MTKSEFMLASPEELDARTWLMMRVWDLLGVSATASRYIVDIGEMNEASVSHQEQRP